MRSSAFTKNNFSKRVIEIALLIPRGRVTTYGRIAKAAGSGGFAAQSITWILGRAEKQGIKGIPFHRIVYANGKIWVDDKHWNERMKLYKKEGVKIDEKNRIINFKEIVLDFK